jgi:sodium/bile acid cotransporter 7
MSGEALALLKRQWFLGALLMIVLIGSSFPQMVMHVTGRVSIRVLVVPVMFLMSLTLDTSEIAAAIRQPVGVVLGVLLGYTVVPLLAWLASQALWHSMPDMAVGLVIVSTMPCTLASATLWTRMAGGNDALALLITVGSNSLSFLAAPVLLALILGRAVALSPLTMMLDLLTVILLPVLGGQLLRLWPLIRDRADHHRSIMSLLGQCMILVLVVTGIARAAIQVQTQGQTVNAGDLLWILGAVAVVHSLSLLLSDLAGRGAGLSRADRMALLFGGSQKTLPAGLFIAQSFFPAFALASIPSLLYHASQLIIDSFVAEGLRKASAKVDLQAERQGRSERGELVA